MFGTQPGDERRKGVLNQHVVTKLDAIRTQYFVLHTRGEDPTSVLVTALLKEGKIARQSMPEMNEMVHSRISEIIDRKTYDTAIEFDRVKDDKVVTWGATNVNTLGELAGKARSSCVIAYQKVDDSE